jgi:hypothetical protein
MRKVSEIISELIMANWEIHSVEHVKMNEFDKGFMTDHNLILEMDKIMTERSEKRKALFNELNNILEIIIKNKKYDYSIEG